jgi:hypothetical protein
MITILLVAGSPIDCLIAQRKIRAVGASLQGKGGIAAPNLGDEIDLGTLDGMDQLTRLVLLKTDSLPGKSDRLDARYINSLMETLYTGLRKPFKSVPADILGIFPRLEFLNISCELSSEVTSNQNERANVERRSLEESVSKTNVSPTSSSEDNYTNYSSYADVEPNVDGSYKSSIQVCRAVTNDCLSMDDLVDILPPTITTSYSVLTRLCPVILFRLMSNVCNRETELISAYQNDRSQEVKEHNNQITNKETINLNTLQILKNLQNSDESNNKRPQKLHKKSKTQTNYQSNVNMNTGSLKQQQVDEQLLKIKLKLSEPSIEKVWIFSLLFVILSIVVSMGGLIVLPFVKKTTRRRILTLFEGLAVGGLTGSATLHMFPQAFGLVDENYHKYFWRIFVVFLGIYLCYLCERTIKILKVVRAKIRRRSRASLIDMDFRYGFRSISLSACKDESSVGNRMMSQEFRDLNIAPSESRPKSIRVWGRKRPETPEFYELNRPDIRSLAKMKIKDSRRIAADDSSHDSKKDKKKKSSKKTRSKKEKSNLRSRDSSMDMQFFDNDISNTNNVSGCESLKLDQSMAPTRQRLVRCLKSVRSQFSPVHVVFNQPAGENEMGSSRPRQAFEYQMDDSWKGRVMHNSRRDRLKEIQTPPNGPYKDSKLSSKRRMKQEEMETMLYHRNFTEQRNRGEVNLNERYQQHRLSDVNDLTGERQDQNNPARMSVDTVVSTVECPNNPTQNGCRSRKINQLILH